MVDAPSALLRIVPLPKSVISLLQALDEAENDLILATLEALQDDKSWRQEVEGFFPGRVLTPDSKPPRFQDLGVAEIAMATAVRRYIKLESFSPELQCYWRYSLACAVACAALSDCIGLNTALAFTSGLLHDLGRLALITAYPVQYANLFATSQRLLGCSGLFNVSEQERLLFGVSRFQTGEWLVDQWGLPPFFKQIVGKFQSTGAAEEVDLIALTRAGCSLVYAFGYGLMLGAPPRAVEDITSVLPPCVMDCFNPDMNGLKQVIDETLDHWPE